MCTFKKSHHYTFLRHNVLVVSIIPKHLQNQVYKTGGFSHVRKGRHQIMKNFLAGHAAVCVIGSPDLFGDFWGQKLILFGDFWARNRQKGSVSGARNWHFSKISIYTYFFLFFTVFFNLWICFFLYCTVCQYPAQKASTQRHGQPASTDIWEKQLI